MHNPYDHMEAPAKLDIIGFIGSQYVSMVSLDSHYSCCQSFSAPHGKGTIHAMDATMLPRVASSSGLCMAWISIVWDKIPNQQQGLTINKLTNSEPRNPLSD